MSDDLWQPERDNVRRDRVVMLWRRRHQHLWENRIVRWWNTDERNVESISGPGCRCGAWRTDVLQRIQDELDAKYERVDG